MVGIAFGQQQFEIERFHERNGEFRDLEFRLLVALSNYWTLSDMFVFVRPLGLTLVGGACLALAGTSVGTWVFFFSAGAIIWPVRQIGRVLVDSGKASVAIDRIQAILGEPVESVRESTERPVEGDIRNSDDICSVTTRARRCSMI